MAKKPFFTIETIQLKKISFEKINKFEIKEQNSEIKADVKSSVIKFNNKEYYLQILISHCIGNEAKDIAKSEIALETKFLIQEGYEKEYKRIIANVLEILYTKGTEILNSTYQKAYLPFYCYEFTTLNEPEDGDIIEN
ncbi:TPA: hypothetical protein RTH14_001686 [Campylobacter jejuni]|nr:hypothetical protein [Campylobacter jejuni]HDZ5099465.1 hypothetical protein [Campylobacter jejuni]HDZ5102826.1 hypothetical protein [Campylobacter jejuni]HDZ5104493.1 hypothetical protein [Campylobacter jejuni]HDZ5109018.1 hypothetical protein [Campylobacter jejuni]